MYQVFRSRHDQVALAAMALLFLLIYWPAILLDYGFHNDYRVRDVFDYSFDYSNPRGMLKHLESMHLLYIGRPLNALAFNLHQSFFQSISDFSTGRLISLLTIFSLAMAFYHFLRTTVRVRRVEAFVLSLAIFCLPSFQLYIVWLTNFVPGALNLAIVTFAYHCAHTGWMRSPAALSRSNIWWIASAFLLLVISLFNYPPTTLFILFYLFMFVAFSKEPFDHVALLSKRILGLTVVAFAVYYIAFKFVYFPLMQGYWGDEFRSYDPNTYRFDLALNAHLVSVLGDLFRYGFLAWMPDSPELSMAIINGAVALIAPLLWLCMPRDKDDDLASIVPKARHGLEKIRLLLLVILASVIPFVVSPNSFVAYRVEVTWFSIVAVTVLGGYLLIYRLIRLYSPMMATIAVIILVGTISFVTATNVHATATNSVVELEYFRTRLSNLPELSREKKVEILVVLPPRYSVFVDQHIALDLSYTATNYSGLMYGIIHMVAEELGVSRDRYQFRSEPWPLASAHHTADIVIDMTAVPKSSKR